MNQWDIYGETPLISAIDLRTRIDGGPGVDRRAEPRLRASTIVKLLLERGANPNMQLFFKPANARGEGDDAWRHAAHPRGRERGFGSL